MIWDISTGLAWVFNWIIMLLFWAGLIILIVWVVKKLSKGGGSAIKKVTGWISLKNDMPKVKSLRQSLSNLRRICPDKIAER